MAGCEGVCGVWEYGSATGSGPGWSAIDEPRRQGNSADFGLGRSGELRRTKAAQSEDCLHLNVWTPALRDRKKRPVLVYFHGGAYNNGSVNSALYDGNRLCHRAQGDVVVVTVNGRLNAFGLHVPWISFAGEPRSRAMWGSWTWCWR